jgi:hypothetical protein
MSAPPLTGPFEWLGGVFVDGYPVAVFKTFDVANAWARKNLQPGTYEIAPLIWEIMPAP